MAGTQLPLRVAHLLSFFFTCTLYGIYYVSAGFCAAAFVRTGNLRRRWVVFTASIVLLVNLTINWVLAIYRVMQAFGLSDNATAVLLNASSWVNVAKVATYFIQPIIGDFILIYRCYVVYDHKWKFVMPSFCLWIGGLSCAIKSIVLQDEQSSQGTVNTADIRSFSIAFSSITVTQNILTSSLLVWKIWSVEHQYREFAYRSEASIQRTTSTRWMKLIRIIVESGLLITFSSFVSLMCRVSSSNGIYAATAIEFAAIGIAFNLIIIRTSARLGETSTLYDTTMTSSIPLHIPSTQIGTSAAHARVSHPPLDVQVVITQETHKDFGSSVNVNDDDGHSTKGAVVT